MPAFPGPKIQWWTRQKGPCSHRTYILKERGKKSYISTYNFRLILKVLFLKKGKIGECDKEGLGERGCFRTGGGEGPSEMLQLRPMWQESLSADDLGGVLSRSWNRQYKAPKARKVECLQRKRRWPQQSEHTPQKRLPVSRGSLGLYLCLEKNMTRFACWSLEDKGPMEQSQPSQTPIS